MPALLNTVDPEGLEEFSVVFTDRSLNHMSTVFQSVMTDISAMLKQVYNADAVALIPGGGTFGMEAVARQFGRDADVNEARSTRVARPLQESRPSQLRQRPVRPSRAQRFRPGADEFGDEAMGEQEFERDPAQVRRAPRQLTSREQYRRIPTRAPPGEEDMDDINLEDEEGDGEEGGAEEVPDGGEVGDGRVVWVRAPRPHGVDQHLAQVEQHRHLGKYQVINHI